MKINCEAVWFRNDKQRLNVQWVQKNYKVAF